MLVVVTGGSGSGKICFCGRNRTFPWRSQKDPISPPCRLLTKKATGASADTGTCVQEKASRQLKSIQSWMSCSSRRTAWSFWSACPIWLQMRCSGKAASRTEVAEKITEGVKNLLSQAKHVVIVTNEIFSDGILYKEESEQYKELGQINQKLAEMAEEELWKSYTGSLYGIKEERKHEKHGTVLRQPLPCFQRSPCPWWTGRKENIKYMMCFFFPL